MPCTLVRSDPLIVKSLGKITSIIQPWDKGTGEIKDTLNSAFVCTFVDPFEVIPPFVNVAGTVTLTLTELL